MEGERAFGPYRLLRRVAVGGMAEIYLAQAQGFGGFSKLIALKMIHQNYSLDEHFVQMLIDEAKISVQLQHVNIGQIFDLGRIGETYYITMEFIDGADLFKVLRRASEVDRDMPVEIAAFIAQEVCAGLDYAHHKTDDEGRPLGVIHRDISPQNVLVSHSGEVKIVDFGIAKAALRARQTAAGVIKGKYYYMSPEQAWGDPVDPRTDIFSAGILLYEMLTGQMLYLEDDLHRLLDRVRRADIAPPTTRRADVPPELERICMRALRKRPEDRWPTAHDFEAALQQFIFAHAPDFTPGRLAAFVRDVLAEDAPAPAVPAPAPPAATGERLAPDEHSVIFRLKDLADAVRQRPQPPPSPAVTGELDDGDDTALTALPPLAAFPSAEVTSPHYVTPERSPTPITALHEQRGAPGPASDFDDGGDPTIIDSGVRRFAPGAGAAGQARSRPRLPGIPDDTDLNEAPDATVAARPRSLGTPHTPARAGVAGTGAASGRTPAPAASRTPARPAPAGPREPPRRAAPPIRPAPAREPSGREPPRRPPPAAARAGAPPARRGGELEDIMELMAASRSAPVRPPPVRPEPRAVPPARSEPVRAAPPARSEPARAAPPARSEPVRAAPPARPAAAPGRAARAAALAIAPPWTEPAAGSLLTGSGAPAAPAAPLGREADVSVDLPPPRPVPAAGPSASALGALAPAPPLAPAGVVAPPALLAAHDSASGMAPLPVVPLARVEAAAAAPPVVSRPFVINLDDSADAGQELRRPESQGFESAGPGFPGAFDPAPALAPPPAPPPLARSPRAAGRLLVGVIGGAAVLILVAAVLLLVLWRQPASGAVEVASVPSGAPVQFDDQPAAKPTPVTVRDVDRRVPHRVRVVQPGYEPWEGRVVFERSQQSLQLIAVLTPIVGVVSIETEPAGAQVALDDRPQGATPRRIEGLPVQSPVRLRVQLPGYRTVERTVEWAGQKTIEVKLKLEREGEATPKRGGKAGRGR